jgi:hypothetical protein
MCQNGKPVAFHSRKMNSAQQNHTTTEKDLLSIFATLKEFRNILLGQQITVFADHKNLTCKNFNTEGIMRWRPVLEQFGPDALSCLEIDNDQDVFNISKWFGCNKDDDLPPSSHPTRCEDIAKAQKDNPALLSKAQNHKDCHEPTFCGGNKDHKLMCHNGKIASSPPSPQQK